MSNYTDQLAGSSINKKLGEIPSVFDFGAAGDGTTDDSAAFNAAVLSLAGSGYSGGAELLVPGGYTFLIEEPIYIDNTVENLTIRGQGPSSVIKRGADMLDGSSDPTVGLFDISGKYITIANLCIDGDVTTTVGVNYTTLATSTIAYDPMQEVLSKNSSIWIKGGAENIVLDRICIKHTGGYAILLDSRTDDITNVLITDSLFENNRPHAFGLDPADLAYGSWTGGIHYQGDCRTAHSLAKVSNLTVDGCTFRRCTGNQIWGHAYAFDTLHANIRVMNSHFEDIGRDAIQLAVTSGGLCSGNTGRRIGYMCDDDTSASVPAYLAGQYAVFLDTSGTQGVNYTDNTAVSVHGAFADLDGFAYGAVKGNTFRVPSTSDVEYAEDSVASWQVASWNGVSTTLSSAGNYTYGVQTANNYFSPGGKNVTITENTIINCAYGAIRLFSARGCNVMNNNIVHPVAYTYAPIVIGNFIPASGGGQVNSYSNAITSNNIQWTPGTAAAAVQELVNWSGSPLNWSSTDKNWVADNRLSGNCWEFYKDATSGSTTGTIISSQVDAPGGNYQTKVVRTKTGAAIYTDFLDETDDLCMRLFNNGQLLVTDNGAAGTGSVVLANRSGTLAFNDVFVGGKALLDSMGVFTDTTFNSTEANLLADTYGIIKYDSTAKKFKQSNATSMGARVWTDLVSPVAGSNTQVIFNDSGVYAGHGGLTYSKVTSVLSAGGGFSGLVFSSTATGATAAVTQASGTFVITGAGNAAFQGLTLTNRLTSAYYAAPGSSTQVMYNDTGVPTGHGGLTYSSVTSVLTAGGGFIGNVVNATATSGTAITVNSGTATISAAGAAAFQSLSLTTRLSTSYYAPAGSNQQIQFNNSGAPGASASLTWNGTTLATSHISVTNNIVASGYITSTLTLYALADLSVSGSAAVAGDIYTTTGYVKAATKFVLGSSDGVTESLATAIANGRQVKGGIITA